MFNKLDCWLKTIWRTLRRIINTGEFDVVSGHLYETIETHQNVTVEVLKCTDCGHIEIEWYVPNNIQH